MLLYVIYHELGVLLRFPAWTNLTDSVIIPEEAEYQAWRATAIGITCVQQKHSFRMRNAWADDRGAVPVFYHICLPRENTIKIDWCSTLSVVDVIESLSGEFV